MRPRCTRKGCQAHVRRWRMQKRGGKPKRGLRVIDGVVWRWFCSRTCSGIESGLRNAASGLLERNLFPAAQGRYKLLNERRQAWFRSEAEALMRYGVPRELAVAMLDRVFQHGHKHGRDSWRREREKAAA